MITASRQLFTVVGICQGYEKAAPHGMDIVPKRMDYLMMSSPLLRREGFPRQRHVILPPHMLRAASRHPLTKGWAPVAAGCFPEARGHHVVRETGLEEVVFIACIAGSGYCELRGKRFGMSSGTAVILPARQPHRYGADEDNPWSISWLHLRGGDAAAFLDLCRVRPEEPRFRFSPIKAFQDEFEQGFDALQASQSLPQLILACSLFRTMFCGLGLRRQSMSARLRTAEEKVEASPLWMRDHLDAPVTLRDLADAVGLSPSHYSALFRVRFGCAPIEFLLRTKIQEACRLLEESALSIAAIGAALGYLDSYYFSRLFKKRTGLAPSYYRSKQKG